MNNCLHHHCKENEHVTLENSIPICPRHRTPLRAATSEPGRGFCGPCYSRGGYAIYGPQTWAWLDKDALNGDQYPPYDGFIPVDLTGVS